MQATRRFGSSTVMALATPHSGASVRSTGAGRAGHGLAVAGQQPQPAAVGQADLVGQHPLHQGEERGQPAALPGHGLGVVVGLAVGRRRGEDDTRPRPDGGAGIDVGDDLHRLTPAAQLGGDGVARPAGDQPGAGRR